MRRGYAPEQLEAISIDANEPSKWSGTGWKYEGYRAGKDGEWTVKAFSVDTETPAVLEMKFDKRFSAEEVAAMVAEQIDWHENGSPNHDQTDYEAAEATAKQARLDSLERKLRQGVTAGKPGVQG